MQQRAVQRLREELCEYLGIVEEIAPEAALLEFAALHRRHAQLAGLYPEAQTHVNAVTPEVLELYQGTYAGQSLGGTAFSALRGMGCGVSDRAEAVAALGHLLLPLAAAEAACVMAYARLKCEALYARELCWYDSRLVLRQRSVPMEPPAIDFFFWVAYGSWSHCPSCGCFRFQD